MNNGYATNTTPLTVEEFSTLSGTFSPCSFMGWSEFGETCPPLTCDVRNRYIGAAISATAMAEAYLGKKGYSLYDRVAHYESAYPRLCLRGNDEPFTLRAIEAPFAFTAPTDCRQDVTLTATIPGLSESDVVVSANLCLGQSQCLRLAAQIHELTVTPAGVVSFKTAAYNLTNLAADPVAFLASPVNVCLKVMRPAFPRAVWEIDPCDCATSPCAVRETEGCMVETREKCYEFRQFALPCPGLPCGQHMIRFEVDLFRAGTWDAGIANAIVSLMNVLLPQEACISCDPMMVQRWRSDNGYDPKGRRDVYASPGYRNVFGIGKPGALAAERALSLATVGTQALAW